MSEPRPDEDVADAVRALSGTVDALRADVNRLAAPTLPHDELPAAPASYAWLSALEAPAPRRPQLPRLLLEILFLGACAAAAAIAGLEPVAIAGVMIGAWVLAALIEWAASRAERRRDELRYAPPPTPPAPAVAAADPAWFSPPVEQTLLDAGAGEDPQTAVTRLPPRLADIEATVERAPDVS